MNPRPPVIRIMTPPPRPAFQPFGRLFVSRRALQRVDQNQFACLLNCATPQLSLFTLARLMAWSLIPPGALRARRAIEQRLHHRP